MTPRLHLLTGVLLLACNSVIMAQRPAPTQSPQATGTKVNAFESVTMIGCIETEGEYWRGQRQGNKADSTSTDQFVLTRTTLAGTPSPAPSAPRTAGEVEPVYQLTGANERLAADLLHRRVEILGKANTTETTHADPTPPTASGQTPAPGRTLPELEVMSIKEVTGSCI